MVIKLMDRFPIVITLGGMLLGWIAGGMAITDPALVLKLQPYMAWLAYVAPAAGALLVLLLGRWQSSRVQAANRHAKAAAQNQAG